MFPKLHFFDPTKSPKQFLEKCPSSAPYQIINSDFCFIDINECKTKIIDYNTKECVFSCPPEKKLGKEKEFTYCLGRCIARFGEFLFNGKCEKDCNQDPNLIEDISDPENKKCICKYLYYVDNNKNIKCHPSKIKECSEKGQKYRIYNSNQ